MKNRIYYSGIAATMVVFIGALFKMQHWPGASVMIVTGIFLLLFIFLPIALLNNYRSEGENRSPLLYFVTWITSIVIFVSMVFKIMHWPGAGWMLIVAIPFPYLVFLPVYLSVTSRNPNHNIYNTVAILFLLALFSTQSVMLSLSVSRERIVDSLNLSATYERAYSIMGSYSQNEGQTRLNTTIDEAIGLIDDYGRIILHHEGITPDQWSDDKAILTDLRLRRLAAAETTGTETEKWDEIMAKVTEIGKLIRSIPDNTLTDDEIRLMLLPDIVLGEIYEWNQSKFGTNIQPWAHIYLDGLRTRLMMIME